MSISRLASSLRRAVLNQDGREVEAPVVALGTLHAATAGGFRQPHDLDYKVFPPHVSTVSTVNASRLSN